jgi:predicted amidohydrolase YtcJ
VLDENTSADMVLLSYDIFAIDPAKIRDVEIVKTIVGGKTVWDSNQNATDNKGR